MNDAVIQLVPFDSSWSDKAMAEAQAIRKILPTVQLDVEHIGSTAVPGMKAKPIIDLMIGVTHLTDAEKFITPLESMGYSFWRDNPIKDRFYFVKGLREFGGTGRTHHIHIVERSSKFWRDHVLFRDYLRIHPSAAGDYQKLKTELASKYSEDREAYTEGKTEFIQQALKLAVGKLTIAHTIAVADGHIATYSIGEGPDVVFVHGGPGDTHAYMARMAEPLFHNFRCVFFDQRGTGKSNNFDRSPENFQIDRLLSDLQAIKTQLRLDRPALVGHSWGAMYALFACIENPNEWNRAALISMGPLDREMEAQAGQRLTSVLNDEEKSQWKSLRLKRNVARDVGDFESVKHADNELMTLRVKAWVFNPDLRAQFLQEYFEDPPPDREINKLIWENIVGWFDWSFLGKIKASLWICTGKNDSVPTSQSERVALETPTTEITLIDNCGHIPWLEHGNLFYSKLRSFLAK